MTKGLILRRLVTAVALFFLIAFVLLSVIQSATAVPARDISDTGSFSTAARAPQQSEATSTNSFFFPNFTLANSSTLNLTGYAQIYTPDYALRLTSASPCCQAGAAWYKTKQNIGDGFETTFDFRITDTIGGGADGLAFVIQNAASATTTVGNAGCGIGYAGISDSLAIEFDTFANPPYCETTGDPNGNHISVQTRGTLPNSQEHAYSLGTFTPAVDLSTGFHKIKISYSYDQDQLTGTLKIFVDNLDAGTAPSLTVHVDLSKTLALSDGQAWVGFVAGTGTTLESHDILNWHFADSWDLTCLEYDFTGGKDHNFVMENGVAPSRNPRGWRTTWSGTAAPPPVGGVAFQRGIAASTPSLFQNDGLDPALVGLIQDPNNPKPITQVRVTYSWSTSPDELPTQVAPSSQVGISIDLKLQDRPDLTHVEKVLTPIERTEQGWYVGRLDTANITHPLGIHVNLQLQNTTQVIYVKKVGFCFAGGAPQRPPVMPPGTREACNALLANLKTRYQPFGPGGVARQLEVSPTASNLTLEPYFEYNLNATGYPANLSYEGASNAATLISCAFMQNGSFYDPNPTSSIPARPIVRFTAMGGTADQRERLALLNYAGYFAVGAARWCYPRDDVFSKMDDRAQPEVYGTGYNVVPPMYRCDLMEKDRNGTLQVGAFINTTDGPCGSFVGSLYRAMGYFNVDSIASAFQQPNDRSALMSALGGLYYGVWAYQYNLAANSYSPINQMIVRTVNNASTYITRPVSFAAIRVYSINGCTTQDSQFCLGGGERIYGQGVDDAATHGNDTKPLSVTLSPMRSNWPASYDPMGIWRAIKPGDIAITTIEQHAGDTAPIYTHIQIVVGWGPSRFSSDYTDEGKGTRTGKNLYPTYNDIPLSKRSQYIPYLLDRYNAVGTGKVTGPRPFHYGLSSTATDFWVVDYTPTQLAQSNNPSTNKTTSLISQPVNKNRPIAVKNESAFPASVVVPGSVAWSPNGQRIALGNQYGIMLYTPSLSQAVPLTGATSTVVALAWSPDSTQLASAEAAQQVTVWNATTGARLTTLKGHTARLTSVVWSPDGGQIASSSQDGMIHLWNAKTFALSSTLPYTGAGYVSALAWSPNGDRLAASDSSNIYIWQAATGELLHVIDVRSYPSGSLVWTSDGQYLITPGAHRWEIATGQVVDEYTACSSGTDTFVAMSPDGHKIAGSGVAASGLSICVDQIDDQYHPAGQTYLQVYDGIGTIGSSAWSPDSQRLAFATQNGWLYLSEVTSGTLQAVAPRLTTTPDELEALVSQCVLDDDWYSHLAYLLTHGDYATFINEVQSQAAGQMNSLCQQQLTRTAEFLSRNPLLPPPAATTPQPLVLESLCTSNMNTQWLWHVRNPNSYEATVNWGWEDQWPTAGAFPFVVPAASGSTAGEWFITTPAQPVSRTLKIVSGSFVTTALNKMNCTNVFLPIIRKGF